jgi:hypothetical protein
MALVARSGPEGYNGPPCPEKTAFGSRPMPGTTARPPIALLIAAALLTGCGGGEAPVPDEAAPPPADDGPSPLPGDAAVTYASLCSPPDGAPYACEVTITRSRENPEAFELVWTGAGHDARGVGMTFGDGMFAAARVGPGGLNVCVYRIEENGLTGWWTGGDGIGAEVIGEVSGGPPSLVAWPDDAVFEVTGEGPDGTGYEGFLQAKPWNGAVVLRWTVGEELIPGGALPLGDWLVAGFNQGTYGVSVYAREGDGWRGRWYVPGDGGFGEERLAPYAE